NKNLLDSSMPENSCTMDNRLLLSPRVPVPSARRESTIVPNCPTKLEHNEQCSCHAFKDELYVECGRQLQSDKLKQLLTSLNKVTVRSLSLNLLTNQTDSTGNQSEIIQLDVADQLFRTLPIIVQQLQITGHQITELSEQSFSALESTAL